MSFTYVGCQTASVGTVSGKKQEDKLTGKWTGNIDGSAQNGLYKGTFDSTKKKYQGTYTNSGGKQYRDLSPCISYWLAPNGTWELFAINSTSTSDANAGDLKVVNNKMTWSAPSAKQDPLATSLISIIDKDKALAGTQDAVVSQVVLDSKVESYDIPSALLTKGRTYISSVSIRNRTSTLYFASKEFVAP